MYKILLLVRDSSTRPTWTPYRVKQSIDNIEQTIEFSTDDKNVLESTIAELIITHSPKKQFGQSTI